MNGSSWSRAAAMQSTRLCFCSPTSPSSSRASSLRSRAASSGFDVASFIRGRGILFTGCIVSSTRCGIVSSNRRLRSRRRDNRSRQDRSVSSRCGCLWSRNTCEILISPNDCRFGRRARADATAPAARRSTRRGRGWRRPMQPLAAPGHRCLRLTPRRTSAPRLSRAGGRSRHPPLAISGVGADALVRPASWMPDQACRRPTLRALSRFPLVAQHPVESRPSRHPPSRR
jgi:hypothetical protein